MHENFYSWYREANIQPAPEILQHRWSAIEKICSRRKDVIVFALELLRVFIGYKPNDNTFVESLITSFIAFDPKFPTRRNSYEIRVLAGISLIYLIENKTRDLTQLIALAVSCGSFQGNISVPVSDLYRLSKDHLRTISTTMRKSFADYDFHQSSLDLNESLTQLISATESNEFPNSKQPLQSLFSEINKHANNIVDDQKIIALVLQLQQEEIDMLWWLLTKTSREFHEPYSDFSFHTACMLIPKELADLTMVIPGPTAIEALIRRMYEVFGDEAKSKITLRKVINELPKEYASLLLDGIEFKFDHLFPLHITLKRSLENNNEKGWAETFDEISKLKSRRQINPVEISKQFYQERLLLGALSV